MSFIKNPGSIAVVNPFDTEMITHYQTFIGLGKDKGLTVYYDHSNYYRECFAAESPYPSYRIAEYDILLRPDPTVCFSSGIFWRGGGYFMFVNYNDELIMTNGNMPGGFLMPDDTFALDAEYWKLAYATPNTILEKSLTGQHCSDKMKNITVIREFPRWERRSDGPGTLNRENLPCGYYDPVDGAEGTLLIGIPVEPESYTDKKYDGKESDATCYICEAMTWK